MNALLVNEIEEPRRGTAEDGLDHDAGIRAPVCD